MDIDELIAQEKKKAEEKIKSDAENPNLATANKYAESWNRGMGLAARALGPIGAGAALGAAAGAPMMGVGAIPGALAGATSAALAGPISDLVVSGYRYLNPQQKTLSDLIKGEAQGSKPVSSMLPTEALEGLMTHIGLPEPRNAPERVAVGGLRAGAETLTGARLAKTLADAAPMMSNAKSIYGTLAEAPTAQTTSSLLGTTASSTANEMGAPGYVSVPLGIAAGSAPFVMRPQNLFASTGGDVRKEHVDVLKNAGIPLSPAQEIGNPSASVFESVMKYLPTSAPTVAKTEDLTQRAYSKNILNRAGIDSDIATPEVLSNARKSFAKEYNALEARTKITEPNAANMFNDLLGIEKNYVVGFPDAIKPTWNARRDEVLKYATGEKVADGKTYQRLQSELSEEIARASRSTDPSSGYYLEAMKGLQSSLAKAMENSAKSPELRNAWKDINRRYSIFSRVEDVMGGAGSTEKLNSGFIPAKQMASVVRARDPRNYAEGMDDFTSFIRAGEAIIPNPTPNSGTAQRSMAQDILTGGKRGAPAAGVAAGSQALGAAAIDPLIAGGLPYFASKAWYGNKYGRDVEGLLAAQAVNRRPQEEE